MVDLLVAVEGMDHVFTFVLNSTEKETFSKPALA